MEDLSQMIEEPIGPETVKNLRLRMVDKTVRATALRCLYQC